MGGTIITQPTRTSNAGLTVMLTDEQKARFKQAAEARGMTLRELVVNAIEQFIAEHDEKAAPQATIDVPWMMRTVTLLLGRVANVELEAKRNRLRLSQRRGTWRNTHTASVRGTIVKLYAESHGDSQLLFEREASNPTWCIGADGALDRLDGGEIGIVVAVDDRTSTRER